MRPLARLVAVDALVSLALVRVDELAPVGRGYVVPAHGLDALALDALALAGLIEVRTYPDFGGLVHALPHSSRYVVPRRPRPGRPPRVRPPGAMALRRAAQALAARIRTLQGGRA